MRKFLRNFFWSHGTPLGYLGSLSQKGHPEIFSKWVLINLSNPLRHPGPLVDPLVTKNLDTAGPWCELAFLDLYGLTQTKTMSFTQNELKIQICILIQTVSHNYLSQIHGVVVMTHEHS